MTEQEAKDMIINVIQLEIHNDPGDYPLLEAMEIMDNAWAPEK